MKLWYFICTIIAMCLIRITLSSLLSEILNATVANIIQFIGVFTSYQFIHYLFYGKKEIEDSEATK